MGSLQSDSVEDDGEKKTKKKKKKKEQSMTTTNGVISAGTGGESRGEARREVQSKTLEPPTKMKRTPSSESKHIKFDLC